MPIAPPLLSPGVQGGHTFLRRQLIVLVACGVKEGSKRDARGWRRVNRLGSYGLERTGRGSWRQRQRRERGGRGSG